MEETLNFKGKDPGAVKYGNFINYYQFHPPDFRMSSLPMDLWKVPSGRDFICLDIGCNSGDLTQALYKFLLKNIQEECECDPVDESSVNPSGCSILAVDIDPVLIARARETNNYPSNIVYEHLDFMSEDREKILSTFLRNHKTKKFDVIFCFSITMWIHLNHGDEGLHQFLVEVCRWTNEVVIEPQPWKCYRTAIRRMKRAGDTFPEFSNLKFRNNIECDIERILQEECKFVKVGETTSTKWGRKTVIYKRKNPELNSMTCQN
ncbi:probable RNA methyltransferase CG11342 [Anabrus simplex]|uniref:probable RNA methyltransferase CG11342 n=1 Tax=Anabrus simplex TaxID=316456 RepID=UPI0035A3D5AC